VAFHTADRDPKEGEARLPQDAGRLFGAWVVMQHAQIEAERLAYQASHQSEIRLETTEGLKLKKNSKIEKNQ